MLWHRRRQRAEPFERIAAVNPAASVRLPEWKVDTDGIAGRNPTPARESSLPAKGVGDMAMIFADSVIELNATLTAPGSKPMGRPVRNASGHSPPGFFHETHCDLRLLADDRPVY